MSRARTTVLALAVSAPLALAGALGPVAAASRTVSYPIAGNAVYPESVSAYRGTFYVSSTTDGTLYRGAVVRGGVTPRPLSVFSKGGADGRSSAIGVEVSPQGDRLVVAGGGTGQVFVYDTKDGRLVAKYSNGKTSGTFINDIAFGPNGDAYVTDSQTAALYRLPAAEIARGAARGGGTTRPLQVFRDFTGTAFAYQPGFNANGITLTPDNKSLVIVQTNTGKLFRVVLATKAVTQVALGGRTLINGDGLELRGDVLYAVRNANNVLSKVKLSRDGARGIVYGQVSSSTFHYPTGAAFSGDQLLVVNSQFDKRSAKQKPGPFTVSGLTNP